MQKVEILCALQKLGEKLTDEEQKFVSDNISNNMKQFEIASINIGKRKKHHISYCDSLLKHILN